MHRSYQPLKPATNRYLQHRWDQEDYDNHRRKVSRHWGGGQPDGMKTSTLTHTHTHKLGNLFAVFTCLGEHCPAGGGQQRDEDTCSHSAQTQKAAGQSSTDGDFFYFFYLPLTIERVTDVYWESVLWLSCRMSGCHASTGTTVSWPPDWWTLFTPGGWWTTTTNTSWGGEVLIADSLVCSPRKHQ